MKVSRTVWSGGKIGDYIKNLPIAILLRLWKGVAENTVEYVRKGDLVGIKGRLQTRTIELEDHNQHVMELVAEKVTFLSNNRAKEAE